MMAISETPMIFECVLFIENILLQVLLHTVPTLNADVSIFASLAKEVAHFNHISQLMNPFLTIKCTRFPPICQASFYSVVKSNQ